MADVTIESALYATGPAEHWLHSRAWTTKDIGYEFYLDQTTTNNLCYKKTTDGGATWAAKVTFYSPASSVGVATFAIWADWWTEGDTGTKIHVLWTDEGDTCRWATLDTASDTISSVVGVLSMAVFGTDGGFNDTGVSIAKMKSGYLRASIRGVSSSNVHYRSTDAGATWGARNDYVETSEDQSIVLPADGTGDDNDAAIIYHDASADAISIKMHDDSANTTTETAIATMVEDNTGAYCNFDAMLGHDGKIRLVFCNAHNTATADLEAWEITPNSIASPTVTAKTNVLTDTQAVVSPRLILDDVNGDIYCFYLRGTLGSSMQVYYKVSTDGMSTWGTETTYAETAAGNLRGLYTQRIVVSGDTGRIGASWVNDTNDDLITGVTNSIEITTGGGGTTTRRYSLSLTGVG